MIADDVIETLTDQAPAESCAGAGYTRSCSEDEPPTNFWADQEVQEVGRFSLLFFFCKFRKDLRYFRVDNFIMTSVMIRKERYFRVDNFIRTSVMIRMERLPRDGVHARANGLICVWANGLIMICSFRRSLEEAGQPHPQQVH